MKTAEQPMNRYDNKAARWNLGRLSDKQLRDEANCVTEKAEPTQDDRDWLAVVRDEQERRNER